MPSSKRPRVYPRDEGYVPTHPWQRQCERRGSTSSSYGACPKALLLVSPNLLQVLLSFSAAVLYAMHLVSLVSNALVFGVAAAVSPLVHLNYTSYRGTVNGNGVTQWLGMRFAAPPLGDLRFAAPQFPSRSYGIQSADAHGPYCLGTNAGPPSNKSDEDCLFMVCMIPKPLQALRREMI